MEGDAGSPVAVLMAEGTKQLRSLAESSALDAIVELLFDYRNQSKLVYSLLELVGFMMMYGRLAEELCNRGVLPVVLEVMLSAPTFGSGLIRLGFEIIWSAIEGVGGSCLEGLARQEYADGLQSLLSTVVKEGYKLEDKCLRNEIVILVNYLLSLPQAVPLFLNSH